MEVKIIERWDKYAKIEVEGEDHTLLHALQDEALRDENVEYVGYHIPYPLERKGIIVIKVKEGDPIVALKKAAKKIIEDMDMIHKLFLETSKGV